ncbi:GntR family transcriptional regulator [Nonomuraea sp. NPDC049269]|uniref:GntR family transcriptional regulator n=1 Tax=Nonomuraea sp. NPDC049269 TaxID=3364349 RepID=UPI0037160EF8
MPSTRGLSRQLGLARGTVTAAYDQLAEEGYLTIRPGSGTTVAHISKPAPASAGRPTTPTTTCAPRSWTTSAAPAAW